MKKVINGRMYNTETAKFIADAFPTTVGDTTDFCYCYERLFKKRTGEYFIAGEGGPSSRWGESWDNGWVGGSGIKPLEEKEAKAWLEKNGDTDSYIEEFGEPEE